MSCIAGHPPGDQIENDDHDQRDDQQDRGHCRRFGELVALDEDMMRTDATSVE